MYFTWRLDHFLFSISSLSTHQWSLIVFSISLCFLSWPLSFWASLHRLSKSEIEFTLDKGTIILSKHTELAAASNLLRLCVWQVFALDKIPAEVFRVGMEHLTARVPEQEGRLRPQRSCQPQKWEISLSWRDLLGEWKCFLLCLIHVGCFLEMWAASVWPTFNEKR